MLSFFTNVVPLIAVVAFFVVIIFLAYFYLFKLPARQKEIIDFLERKNHLDENEIAYLKSLSRFDNIWSKFNIPAKGINFNNNAFIDDLMEFVVLVKGKYSEQRTRDNFIK